MELGLRETKDLDWLGSLEGKQTVMTSYWRVSNSLSAKSLAVLSYLASSSRAVGRLNEFVK